MQHVSERLLNWASIIEPETLAQAERTAKMPFIYPHLALMPDAHLGKGATVGSVIPTLGAIVPAAVGVDIGCGMIALRSQYTLADIKGLNRARLRKAIEKAIPLSAGNYNRELTASARRRSAELEDIPGVGTAEGIAPKWRLQLGSLGSGNHFIEVSADELDRIWLFLHSGSRGVGNQIAQRHIKIARDECQRREIRLADRDLAYLEEGTHQFDAYIRDLTWAQRFALLNREEMMDRLAECFGTWVGEPVAELERINCHHNYSVREHHFGKDVWLSRKGAINAAEGVAGLIPGSMGTASYVVVGKGNRDALNSAPHGAGRNYSRSRARRTFTHEQLRKAMAGIEWRDTAAFLDEIPEAYKDIDVVMADAADLVEIRHTLRQIVNVKGD
ncbi:RtcB family protein [Phytoactinopolyspora mesophila]|uniref:3'-phosphate/5'-hydroxy nucleic acid ligase n=1 Tax=Phytoactinopolyspora mesophila TaxID=2650750 RepID=A0A7K3LYJ5_9ACTN|nr:RtcB family protein [Phytoactinopolyspora mesophila]NDL55887.1 RtcB family protein [Phytoactinopolyspora mesophila]